MSGCDEGQDTNAEAPADPPRLGRLGNTLREAYQDTATEPLPQVFEELLSQLR